jgi:uncharacterized ferredoxin-like protein
MARLEIGNVLSMIGNAASAVAQAKQIVDSVRGTLSQADSEKVSAALQGLREQNDELFTSVDAKLAAASQSKG